MAKLPLIARILLGLIYAVLGVVGLFGLGPQPELEGAAAEFMSGLMGSGYFWPVLKVTEIVCGILLLMGLFVPLALVILAPITLQILLFHLFLDPSTIVIAAVILLLHLYLGYAYRTSYFTVLVRSAKPA